MKRFYFLLLIAGNIMAATEPKMIIESDPTLLISTIDIIVTTGATDDPVEKAGLSSLLSELMLRGTKKKTRTAFQSELERLGASIGVSAGIENIVFEAKVIKENTDALLKLIREFILEPGFKAADFDALKKEQLAEIAHRKNNNSRLAGLAVRREAFKGTALQYSAEGSLGTVAKVSVDDVKRAYNDRFHRGNVLFAISTSVPVEGISAKLKAIWDELPDGHRLNRRSLKLNIPSKPTLIVVNKPDTSTGSVLMAQSGITAKDDSRYILSLANAAFGGEPFVSRLFKVIRGELGWTYSIGSTYHAMGQLTHQQGMYVVSGTPSVEFTSKSILKSLAMFQDYLKSGLKGEEIAVVKESQINSYPFEFDSAEKRLSKKVYSYLYNVPVLTPDEYAKKLNGYSQKDLVAALQNVHATQGWWIAVTADAKALEKQLNEEQKELPKESRLAISKVLSPEQVIQ